MAPDFVTGFGFADLDQGRVNGLALLHDLRAARVEPAAGGRVQRRRHVAGQQDAFVFHRGVRQGVGGQQGLGVGMFGVGEQGAGGRHFREFAQIHDGDPVGEVLHHVQVVRDEQVGQVILRLQVLEQVDDLRLNGHVQSRDRLVAHDQLRVQRQGARNADPLALPA